MKRLQAAALQHDPPSDLKPLKEAVRRALAVPGGFVDRRGVRAFVARADSAPLLVRDLLAKRRALDAVGVADYAMRRGIVAYQKCDDSGGAFGDTLREIARLHLDACRGAKPEPEALGAQLFGERGIARHRALAGKACKVYGSSRRAAKARQRSFELLPLDVTSDESVEANCFADARLPA